MASRSRCSIRSQSCSDGSTSIRPRPDDRRRRAHARPAPPRTPARASPLHPRAESERRSLAVVLGNLHPSIPRTAAFLERLAACMMAIYRRGDLIRHDQPT